MAETHFKEYMLLLMLMMMMMMMIWGLLPCGCCPDDQKAALLEFKSLFHGNSSVADRISSWNASVSCCEWSGVYCGSRHPSITGLDLREWEWELELQPVETGVSADVLTPLFRLTSLRFLDLSGDSIRGEIPRGIANLTRLQALDLSDNHFSGPILPQLFSALPHLQRLTLDRNSLQGKIPIEIGNFTNLLHLTLGNNKLSGEIPTALLQMNKLEYLELQGNFLSGEIPSVQNMTQLAFLTLGNNLLSGEIPSWLFESSTISSLDLGNNNLTLTNAKQMAPKSRFVALCLTSCNISSHGIPAWLANQTDLLALDLSSNRMTGTFPRWLAEMQIMYLTLADNLLQGTLPPELAVNAYIIFLDLSKNNFEGEIFANKATNQTQETMYEVLLLSDNKFTGSIGVHISNMTLLVWLDLSRNQLSGEAFVFLCQQFYRCPSFINLSFNTFHGNISISSDHAHYLEVLEVAHNHFSHIYLPTNLETLKLLDVHDNRVLGEIPFSLAQISSLQILSLANNLLRGLIPTMLSNLTRLQILDLSGNKLRGRVPNSLGNLAGMTVAPNELSIPDVYLSRNLTYSYSNMFASTPIPLLDVFWKTHHQGLPNNHLGLYTFLDLSNNQLSGEIPNSLGNLRSLKVLNFSHNSLSGRIPSSFGNTKELESLDLSHNNLSGEIPESMGTLLQITNLQLSNNNLAGRIPTGPQMDTMNDPDSYANNNARLCGMQIRKPCDDPVTAPTQEAAPRGESESEEGLWFSWMTAGIGYPAGFVTTVLGMYGFGYFHQDPKLQHRRRMMRRRAIRF